MIMAVMSWITQQRIAKPHLAQTRKSLWIGQYNSLERSNIKAVGFQKGQDAMQKVMAKA